MKISKISMAQPLSFKAKTTINAPENLLSKEDKAYFEDLGSKLGKNTDTIDISISELQKSKVASDIQGYQFSKSIVKKRANHFEETKSSVFIPYIKDGVVNSKAEPKEYLATIFERLTDTFSK